MANVASFSSEVLKEKLKEPLALTSAKQGKQIWDALVVMGMCLLDTSEKVGSLVEKIDGNGKIGLSDKVGEIDRKVTSLSEMKEVVDTLKIRKSDTSSDPYLKTVRWFVDKVLPSLVTSLLTVLALILYLSANHIQFGK